MPAERGFGRRMLDKCSALIALFWFPGSARYWEARYRLNGSSGSGSYGASARFKAAYINALVAEKGIARAVEYGCGDGAQLQLLDIPEYIGLDVSHTAIERCRRIFADDRTKRFAVIGGFAPPEAELALSLDVIYHLVEDEAFSSYMSSLFGSGARFVLIYSTDHEDAYSAPSRHVRHRDVSSYCAAHFPIYRQIGGSDAFPGSGALGPRFILFEKNR